MALTNQSSGFSRPLKIGLGCFAVLIALVGTIVVLNWDRLKSASQSDAATLAELQSVRSAIQANYDTRQVGAFTKELRSRPRDAALPKRTLLVELLNPPFLKDLPQDELESKVREIAEVARSAHPSPLEFDAVEVILTTRTGFLFTVGSRRHFILRSEDLSGYEEGPPGVP